MASLAHVLVGVAAARAFARGASPRPSPRVLGAWMMRFSALSLAPDLDVLAFIAGIPYAAPFGHRGASHSLAAALAAALVAWIGARTLAHRAPGRLAAIVLTVAASHGILDAFTDGGEGVALLWPLTTTRYFFPWRPIPVAPIGRALVGAEGARVMGWELAVFLPLALYAFWPRRR